MTAEPRLADLLAIGMELARPLQRHGEVALSRISAGLHLRSDHLRLDFLRDRVVLRHSELPPSLLRGIVRVVSRKLGFQPVDPGDPTWNPQPEDILAAVPALGTELETRTRSLPVERSHRDAEPPEIKTGAPDPDPDAEHPNEDDYRPGL